MTKAVKSRAVFFIGGYDPKSPDVFYTRMDRELGRFQDLWDTSVEQGKVTINGDVSTRRFAANGDGWTTETDFNFLTLDDIVLRDFERPFFQRLWRSLVTSSDYIFSGTAFKFLRHAWRFFLYFAYPVGMPPATLIVALAVAMIVWTSGISLVPIAATVAFLVVAALMVQFVWKRYFVLHLMDLWSFSRDFIHRSRDDIETKLDRFSDLIVEASQEGTYDEIILIGHSTGGALILDAAGRAAEKDAQLAGRKAEVTVLTVGSTALKIGLHPAAGWFRDRLRHLFADPKMNWVEYQCLTDLINFFRTDPAKLMGLALASHNNGEPRPLVRSITVKKMMAHEIYRRIKRNWFRVHYQFVFGNTKKYHYDFLGICFGPATVPDRARNPSHFAQTLTPQEERTQ